MTPQWFKPDDFGYPIRMERDVRRIVIRGQETESRCPCGELGLHLIVGPRALVAPCDECYEGIVASYRWFAVPTA